MVELGAAGALDLPEDITGRQLKDTVDDNGSVVEGLLTQFDKERHELVDLCFSDASDDEEEQHEQEENGGGGGGGGSVTTVLDPPVAIF